MDEYQQYKKDRHAAHVANRNCLNDLAFKTSERYDQWVLTLAGGALAISLTFLEKIAPDPIKWTLIILGLSWLAFILAILAGFCAIFFSREAIYKQIKIGDAEYRQFRETSTEENPVGTVLAEEENEYNKTVKRLTNTSVTCLTAGTFLMCLFALINVATTKGDTATQPVRTICISVPQTTTTNITIKINLDHE